MMTTEVLFFDQSLRFSNDVLTRHKTLKPSTVDDGGYVVNRGLDGSDYLTQHPLYYAAASVPLYGSMHFIHPKVAYYSFFIGNLIYLIITIIALIYYFKQILGYKGYVHLVFGLIFFSTVTPYILWSHPETFIFMNVTLFFVFLYGLKKPLLSSLFLGLAVGQSIVLVFLALNLIYYLLFFEKPKVMRIIHSTLIFGFVSSLHYIVSYLLTGRFFSLSNYSTISFLAMRDIVYEIFDPSVGLVWFYPMVITSLVFVRKSVRSVVILISVFLCMAFFMVNNQFYTHQVGLRYLNYIYPAFFFLFDMTKIKRNMILFIMLLGMSAFLTAGLVTDMTSSHKSMDPTTKNLIGYRFVSKALFPYYKEHPSVFIYHSTLLQNDLPYVNDLSDFNVFASNDGGTIYNKNGWIVNNPWTRIMLNPVKPGTLKISLERECATSEYIVANKKQKVDSKQIDFVVSESMIKHTDKHDMNAKFSDYLYVDLKSDPGCGIIKLKKIVNNGHVVYLNRQ